MSKEEIIYVATNKGVIVPTRNNGFAFISKYSIIKRPNDDDGLYMHIKEKNGNGEGYIFLSFDSFGKDWFVNEGD